jgi:CPA1 family monovalent cation:H+ antiporter
MVLMTLFINGTTLRPLIRLFQLNRLSPVAAGVRDRAAVMTLAEVRDQVAEAAERGRIDRNVVDTVLSDIDARLAVERSICEPIGSVDGVLAHRQTMRVGLTVMTARESGRYLDLLHARIVDRRVAEQLLAHAQQLRDAVRPQGHAGTERKRWEADQAFKKTWRRLLRYERRIRFALFLQNRLRFERPLAVALAERFEVLVNQRRILAEMTPFIRDRLGSLLGEAITDALIELNGDRAKAVEDALLALKLQYPTYAEALQHQHLARLARIWEHRGYQELLAQGVIGGEVAQALTEDSADRYPGIDRRPRLDTRMSARDLVARVPLFANLPEHASAHIVRQLRPRLTLPEEFIVRKGDRGESMFFIASGAVRIVIPGGDVELGSGDFFGELALITGRPRVTDVISLGFCQLLELGAADFRALLAGDPALKAQIETVANQRLGSGSAAAK